jgi:hypothetical protein
MSLDVQQYIEMRDDRAPVPKHELLFVRAEATSAPEQELDEGGVLLTNNIPPHSQGLLLYHWYFAT